MSRIRQRSQQAAQQITSMRMAQRQAAQTVMASSDAATQLEMVQTVSDEVGAIDIEAINAALADLDTRVTALESP